MSLATAKILAVFVFLFSTYISSRSQVNYYAPKNIHSFANYLYQTGDYLRAAAEYQRYFFSSHSDSLSDSLLYRIGQCYQLGGKSDIAINFYHCFLINYPQSKLREQTHYQIARTYFQTGKYDDSIEYIRHNSWALTSDDVRMRMDQLLGINFLYQRHWHTAHHFFSSLLLKTNLDKVDSTTISLNNSAIEGTELNYKSGMVAGLLSAGVPGTGKIYAGRYEDGLFSLLMIGLYCWQAFDGFNRNGKNSVKGWIYGTLGAIFYLGNIYGSIVAVKIHNEKIEENFLHKLELELKWK